MEILHWLQSSKLGNNQRSCPIPIVEDMLDPVHGTAYFTKLDLTAGYHQVRMYPSDIH